MSRLASLEPFELSLSTPLETAAGRIDDRRGFLLRVSDGEGEGIGEATPLPGWTESETRCRAALQAIETVDDDVLADLDASAARHGLSLALADLHARREGVPLARWFGAETSTDRVPVNATVGDLAPAETRARATEAVEEGFRTLKLKIGVRPVGEDVARVREVREAVGDGVDLRLDANGAWGREEAESALEALSVFSPEYVEQPLSAADIDGIRALESDVPIALDESLRTGDLERCLEVADVLVCKPMVFGGPDRVLEVADRARGAGVEVVLTTTIDAVVARLGTLALAAAVSPGTAHGLATGGLFAEDLGTDPAPVSEGSIRLPSAPGLGIEWGELRV